MQVQPLDVLIFGHDEWTNSRDIMKNFGCMSLMLCAIESFMVDYN